MKIYVRSGIMNGDSVIDPDTLVRVKNLLVDKDIYTQAEALCAKFSSISNYMLQKFSNLNWEDCNPPSFKPGYWCGYGDDKFCVFISLNCDKFEGGYYIKSFDHKDSQSYFPLILDMAVSQEHDEGDYWSELSVALVFPNVADGSDKESLLSYSTNELYDFTVNSITSLVKKHIATYNKSSSKTRIKNSDLLDMAENIWVAVTDEDFRHELSQEELIEDTLGRLEENLGQQLTSNQRTTVTRFLKKFGEFKYRGPNGLHYDMDQPWL